MDFKGSLGFGDVMADLTRKPLDDVTDTVHGGQVRFEIILAFEDLRTDFTLN